MKNVRKQKLRAASEIKYDDHKHLVSLGPFEKHS